MHTFKVGKVYHCVTPFSVEKYKVLARTKCFVTVCQTNPWGDDLPRRYRVWAPREADFTTPYGNTEFICVGYKRRRSVWACDENGFAFFSETKREEKLS